ncbi:phosphoribosylglycinamide formyltransferase [Gloeobacter kilaueensis]|uniref:Phosphoribosylglycinamide formyltransferase n=1 Tax=Gloeobacter kilaueensis (strain ATCC BAA-2537 / CCAP 1431/1 / ULC 316 / JS1) TaxID=1183438 RepID=U5QMW0_GLOK1|nr:phosphoribosylglycinamide formyltransferase [Gloeobacter kilaueensis]AGY58934.1 phosphoribosylglycinamide formyltransferase [Gloeobacter kilaueensis JS1]
MALRLGVLASGSGTNFQVLAEGAQTGELPVQIAVLIYNNPDAYVAQRAKALGIPAVLLDHRLYQSREALDEQIALTLEAHAVELVVMAGWMRRVTAVLIDRFADRILNVHPSLLPSFRGAKAIEQALDYGVKVTGCSVHIVRLEVDAGPIILQSPVEVREDDTPATLAERIHAQEYRILPEAVRLFAEGRIAIEGNRARLYL